MRHLVADNEQLSSSAAVTEAYVNGTPLTALCGSVFVPSRDPNTQPPCLDCESQVE